MKANSKKRPTRALKVGEKVIITNKSDSTWDHIQGVDSGALGRIIRHLVVYAGILSIDDLEVVPKEETEWANNDKVIAGAFCTEKKFCLPIMECESSK